jgi:hypothetical protein
VVPEVRRRQLLRGDRQADPGRLLEARIPEPWWRDLAELVLFHDPRAPTSCCCRRRAGAGAAAQAPRRAAGASGLPIGNLSSQFFANVYLDRLDQFVKHVSCARGTTSATSMTSCCCTSRASGSQATLEGDRGLPAARARIRLNPAKTILQPVDARHRLRRPGAEAVASPDPAAHVQRGAARARAAAIAVDLAPPRTATSACCARQEKERHAPYGYMKYEEYPQPNPDGTSAIGRFWTQAQLDKIGKGCGTLTTMAQAIAETYARNPHFYGSTYCCGCSMHLPVGQHGEFVWDGTEERVGS